MTRSMLFFITLLFPILRLDAQTILRGRVIDNYTLKPLYGATVSANNAGVTTNTNGEFAVPVGTREITVSRLGYQSRTLTIKPATVNLTVDLSPSNVALNEVTVTASASNKKNIEVPNAIGI